MERIEINEELKNLLGNAVELMPKFKKKNYDELFEGLKVKYQSVLWGIQTCYREGGEDIASISEFSMAFANKAQEDFQGLSKRAASYKLTDYNMAMVSLVIPLVTSLNDEMLETFADLCIENWNTEFKTSIQKSSKGDIQGGFRNGLCYITTAVCQSQNKADDCYELSLLRNFRDDYLIHASNEGGALVREYYNIAPTIVKHINRLSNAAEVYQSIWEKYLKSCIELIEANKKEECKDLYIKMVKTLKDKFF